VFCGAISGQRQDGVDIVKRCILAADDGRANPSNQKLHAKTQNEILIGQTYPQCDTYGERPATRKHLRLPVGCRENPTKLSDGGHRLPVEADTVPVISSSEGTRPNIDDAAGFGSRNEGDTPTDLPAGGPAGRTRTHRILGPLHDPLWFIEPDTPLPTRPAMHWSESVEGAYLWSIALLGGVTNTIVLVTCACSRRALRPLHVLVAALALADLLVACVYVPTYTYLLVDVPAASVTAADRRMCRIARGVFVLAAGASLSVKDLIAIYFRLMVGSRRWRHRIFRHTPVLALLAWLVNAAVIFAPCYAGFPLVDLYPNALPCATAANGTVDRWKAHAEQAYYPTGVTFVCFVEVHVAILTGRRMCKLQRYSTEIPPQPAREEKQQTGQRTVCQMKLLCTCRCRDRKVTSTQFLVARTSDLTGVYDSYDTARLLEESARAV
ncbi:hypothetical protein NP493_51g05036, partial [Ridgeia piscesae]